MPARMTDAEKQFRRAIRDARSLVQQAEKADANEAETRRRIERIFETVMGYDPFTHLSRERAVRGAGETEHVDFAIQLEGGEDARPVIMVEIKRVAIDLSRKHLKQVTSYAIDAGCEWTLLTNAREWRLYRVEFGQPPETREVRTWHLINDDIESLVTAFELLSLKSLKRGVLDELWQKASVLQPRSVLEAVFCEATISTIRKELRKKSGVLLPHEDVVKALRRLLHEAAATELQSVKISLPRQKPRKSNASTSQASDADGAQSSEDLGGDDEADELAAPVAFTAAENDE